MDHSGRSCRGDLRCLGSGAGERRVQHDRGKAAEFPCLKRLTCQVALNHLDAAGKADPVGRGAQGGRRGRIAFPRTATRARFDSAKVSVPQPA